MSRFRFRLEPVLRLRSAELDQGRRALARAEALLARAREVARDSGDAARAEAESTLHALAEGTPASWLRSLWASTGSRFGAASEALREETRQRAATGSARDSLLATWRSARSLEWLKQRVALRERAFHEHLAERELDDLTRRAAAPEER